MIVADASVVIAWLDDRDPHHVEAIDELASVEHFFVHPLTLAEVLVHAAGQGRERAVMSRLEAIGMIVSSQPLDPLQLARLRATTRLRMPDCVVLACADTHDLRIATFDKALRRATDARRAK